MQSLIITPALQNSTRVFVDNNNFPVHDHVVAILFEQFLCSNCVVQVTNERRVNSVVQIVNSEFVFDNVNCFLEHTNSLLFLVNFIMLVTRHFVGNPRKLCVPFSCLVCGSTNNEWRSGFIYKD